MGIIVGIILFIILLGVIVNLVESSGASKLLRPYIGLLLIAVLIAAGGFVVGFLSSGIQGVFFTVAKIIAVLTCVALCLHLIVIVAKRWL